MKPTLFLLSTLAVASSNELGAQETEPPSEIVVEAQLSGAPMWTIATERGTIVLVGEIRNVPKSTPWFPDRLEAATAGAQRVILGTRPKISPGDILRIIFAGGKITRLPKGTVAADYLDEAQAARLASLSERYDEDYTKRSLLMTAFNLLTEQLGFNRDTGRDASEVVERAARRADVPAEPVGTVRGEDMLDSLAAAPPETHLPCLDAAMSAAELGPDNIAKRGQDWRSFDVPAVMANPIEVAMGRCWPWTDAEVGGELRGQWTDAIDNAAAAEGITLAVAPLRVLAEPDGVLDRLVARGFEVEGPAWR